LSQLEGIVPFTSMATSQVFIQPTIISNCDKLCQHITIQTFYRFKIFFMYIQTWHFFFQIK
jgi:hypothetical protein